MQTGTLGGFQRSLGDTTVKQLKAVCSASGAVWSRDSSICLSELFNLLGGCKDFPPLFPRIFLLACCPQRGHLRFHLPRVGGGELVFRPQRGLGSAAILGELRIGSLFFSPSCFCLLLLHQMAAAGTGCL